ncbi:MAG: hypothetical protein HON42_04980 [Alphaproteobacteria bacterium]|nr:hypothetical protein [Alphaproteobacteria bacterium]
MSTGKKDPLHHFLLLGSREIIGADKKGFLHLANYRVMASIAASLYTYLQAFITILTGRL